MRYKFGARIPGARITALILTFIFISAVISIYSDLAWADDDESDDDEDCIRQDTRRSKWRFKDRFMRKRYKQNSRCRKPISTPSPASLLVFATGIAGVVVYYRRKKSN